jgi:hypothetical protein
MLQGLMHDRITLEACENIHFHWRNLRVEMSMSDAVRMLDLCWRFESLMPLLQGRIVNIPLASICPYDTRHRRVSDDEFDCGTLDATQEHVAGIAWIVEQMNSGRKPWPIAVRPAWRSRFSRSEDRLPGNVWQRLDGFKRFMAHRALKRETIECVIVAGDRPGCQHGHRPFQETGEQLPYGFPRDFFLDASPDRLSLVDADKQRYRINQVELLKNGTIHVHLGDIRLEFTRGEFLTLADMIQEARAAL